MPKDNPIKPSWVVFTNDGQPIFHDDTGEPLEFSTERAALKRAKETIKLNGEFNETWVFRLTHVVARPETEPTVDVVK